MKADKIKYQLFIGKVVAKIGFEETNRLLSDAEREAKDMVELIQDKEVIKKHCDYCRNIYFYIDEENKTRCTTCRGLN